MMQAQIGNPAPIESYIDRQTGRVKVRRLSGKRITTFHFPDDMDSREVYMNIVDAMPKHIQDGAKPAWVESDDLELTMQLCMTYDIPFMNNKRPADWGAGIKPFDPKDN